MPPSVQNTWFFLGAAVVGLVSAASVFIVEHYRHERRRHTMAQDLARLDKQVSGMRKELEQLQTLQKETAAKSRKTRRSTSRNVSVLSNTGDDYTTAADIDSSDMEFYDLSDAEDQTLVSSTPTFSDTSDKLKEIDVMLDQGDQLLYNEALVRLTKMSLETPNDAEVFWRIGKCYHKLSKKVQESKEKEGHINNGISACKKALQINSDLADCHKWFAILIGSRGEFQPIKNRIQDGHTFKKHVDIAIKLKPGDATLHHMLGRFAFEVASLKWYERKAATALFSEPPSATYEDALKHLLESEELTTESWKENKLILAKCYINMGEYKEAMYWLDKAHDLETNEDDSIELEIQKLREKFCNHR